MRRKKIVRDTKETQIVLALEVDGTGAYEINTGCGFLNHMLELFARHGRFDLAVDCKGDTHVDFHHTTEDIGIALGAAFRQALGDKRGIYRYGSMLLPMDEALILTAVDISGRTSVNFDVDIPAQKVGDFDTELVKEFILAFARELGLTIHVRMLAGENTHHIIEGVFKSMARALRQACAIEKEYADEIPSTKGVL
ncbi:MAG: imidazoleglycerol-phosphate dehydratase HisB [Firmicutes bacterium]|nr:imidazoleglycerol-phosphate dehydratase HisB [Bacillota bacterium]